MKIFVKSKLNFLLIFLLFIFLVAFFGLKIEKKDKLQTISTRYLKNYAKGDFAKNKKYLDYELTKLELNNIMSLRDKRLSKANLLLTNPLKYEEDGLEKAYVYYDFVIQGNKSIESGVLELYKDDGKWLISSN